MRGVELRKVGHNLHIHQRIEISRARPESQTVRPDASGERELVRMVFKGSKRKLQKLLEKYNAGRILEDLGSDWYSVEVDPDKLPTIYNSLPEDAKLFRDKEIPLIKPIELTRPPEVGKEVPSKPLRLSASMPAINVDKVWKEFGLTGKSDKFVIAIVDTGIAPHEDIKDRIEYFADITKDQYDVEPSDGQGHGTHVAGDAAGSGKASDGKIKGPAYEAKLWGIKVLGDDGYGSLSDVIKGINHVVEMAKKTGKRVIMNMSLGASATRPWDEDPVALAVQEAAKTGLVIPVVAAGNSGPEAGTVASPGIAPLAITVAADDTKRTPVVEDDDIAQFSSRGPVKYAPDESSKHKPDIASPGVGIWGPNAPDSAIDHSLWVEHSPDRKYVKLSGTSMATPIVSGVIALMLQANPDLTVEQIKDILTKTARPLKKEDPTDHKPYDDYDQGAGVIDAYAAVKMAMELKRVAQN